MNEAPPDDLIEDFLKSASQALMKPFGVSDASKAMNRSLPQKVQTYAQPNPPLAQPPLPPPVS